jgi:hypothetical protein
MARRKKRKATSRRRSRRMGAVKNQLMDAVTLTAGAVAGTIVASKLFPNIDEKIKNAAVIGIGAFLMPKVLKGAIGQNLGNGMIAAGGLGLLKSFNVIGAVSDMLEVPVQIGAVEDNISLISGTDSVMAGDRVMAGDDLSIMAGVDEEEYGY